MERETMETSMGESSYEGATLIGFRRCFNNVIFFVFFLLFLEYHTTKFAAFDNKLKIMIV
jgi:hypothetical protein